MPMILSNGNRQPLTQPVLINTASLATTTTTSQPVNRVKSTALNSSIIGRIHNAKPGCGSCGRH